MNEDPWHRRVKVALLTLERAALFGHADDCSAKDAPDAMLFGGHCPTCGRLIVDKPSVVQVTEALETLLSANSSAWRVLERWDAFNAAVKQLQSAVEQGDVEAARKLAREVNEVRRGIGGQP